MAAIRYIVKDIDEALPFYQALGFSVKDRWGPPFAMLEKGDLELWLSGPGSSASRTLPSGAVPASGGWNRFVLQVDDLRAAMAALSAKGARFRSDPVKGPGGEQVVAEDPSGNPVELFQSSPA